MNIEGKKYLKESGNYLKNHREMWRIVQHLAKPKPLIYWIDFSISALIGWSLFFMSFYVSPINACVFIFISAIALYRAAIFTHELVHLKKGDVPGFYAFWNLFCGIPLLSPHFLYYCVHNSHHGRRTYGTLEDGEYLPFGVSSRFLTLMHLIFNFIAPFLSVFRFLVIAPISFLHPKLRLLIMKKMSYMALRFTFTRKIPAQKNEINTWLAEELACLLFLLTIALAIFFEIIMFNVIVTWYFLVVTILTLNSLRTFGASHLYLSNGKEMPIDLQISDTVNIKSNSIFTKIICPVGTQYHAIHHMYPSIPYHALGKSFDLLLKNYSNKKIIEETTFKSLFHSWKYFLKRC